MRYDLRTVPQGNRTGCISRLERGRYAMKICSQCKREKQDDEYYHDKTNICKTCYCQNSKEWRQKNKEKTRAYCKNRYWEDPEKARKRVRDWQKKNPEKHKERNNNWIANNIEKYKKRQDKWRSENREVLLKSRKLSNSKRRAASKDKIEIKEWNELLVLYDNKCLCCGRNDKKLTIDHIIPLSKGGKNVIDNVQPLCMDCNRKKHVKTIDYRKGHKE